MNENNSFRRWQEVSITQFGYTINLLIGISTGLLLFLFNFVNHSSADLTCAIKVLFWFSIILLSSSSFFGVLCSITRLEDFRLTAKISRIREYKSKFDLKALRAETKKLGDKSWNYFVTQASTLLIGFLLTSIVLIVLVSDKIT